ncbi:MAG: GDP-mannose 4,6-dehydratase [Terriglobia bacterium]
MRALVTGIAGFAGNYLTQLLLAEHVEIYGVSQEKEFKPFLDIDGSAIHYCTADIRHERQIAEIVSKVRPDLMFHLAAKSSPSSSVDRPVETFEVNLRGTLNLLEALRVAAIRCRFLLVSSSRVYGDPAGTGPVSEEAPLRPATPYAASKAAAEMAAYQYWKTYGIEVVTVRPFNHTGAGQPAGFVAPDLARKVVEIERGLRPPVLDVKNLRQEIDFSHVRDIVRGYYSASVNGAEGRVYNLCSGQAISIRSMAEELISVSSNEEIDLRPPIGESRPERLPGVIGDNSRARGELGWQPALSISAALRELLEYSRHSYRGSASPEQSNVFQSAPRACS